MNSRYALILALVAFTASCTQRVEYPRDIAVGASEAIDLNTATVEEIERLPGIGRGLAERVVEFRRDNGAFSRVEHIILVRGLSENRYAAIAPYITITNK